MDKTAIICVDNNVMELYKIKDELTLHFSESYNIYSATSGAEFELLINSLYKKNTIIALVISEYAMNDVKGDTILLKAKKLYPNIITILLANIAFLSDIKSIINKIQVFKYIKKPWDKNILKNVVDEGLNKYNSFQNTLNKNIEYKKINKDLDETIVKMQNELFQFHDMYKTINEFNNIVDNFEKVKTDIEIMMKDFDNNCRLINNLKIEISKIEDFFTKANSMQKELSENLKNNTLNTEVQYSNEKIISWHDEEMYIFNINKIAFFSKDKKNRKTFLQINNHKKYYIKDSLDDLEEKYKKNGFFRCHKSFLINLNMIKKISPWLGNNSHDVTLENIDDAIPISRNRYTEIKRELEKV